MSKKKEADTVARRDFFRQAVGLGAAGAAAALGATSANAGQVSEETQGYRETDHVKTYYELARF